MDVRRAARRKVDQASQSPIIVLIIMILMIVFQIVFLIIIFIIKIIIINSSSIKNY